MYLGQPQAIGIQPGEASGQEQAMTSDEVTQMVSGLAAKLAQNPDNPAGWAMLVRSYKALGQLQEAEAAYDRALPYIANDPQMLADYADVSAANAQGKFTGKPERLIAKALSLDAKHPLALWLAGTAAFEAANYPVAVQHWERLLAQLPPDSEDAKVISQTLARVKAKLNTSPRIRQD
jgi:cytochrome c-type biogenesis protein CcmH